MNAVMRLRDLPGLGPASEAMLVEAGIDTPAALQRAGAVGAFLAVERSLGGTSLNLLYALVGAIEGRPWTAVAREDREAVAPVYCDWDDLQMTEQPLSDWTGDDD